MIQNPSLALALVQGMRRTNENNRWKKKKQKAINIIWTVMGVRWNIIILSTQNAQASCRRAFVIAMVALPQHQRKHNGKGYTHKKIDGEKGEKMYRDGFIECE